MFDLIDIPDWIVTFMLGGIALLVIVVPIMVFRRAARGGKDGAKRMKDLATRLRERFPDVREGNTTVKFQYDGRPCTLAVSFPHKVRLDLKDPVAPPFPVVFCRPTALRGKYLFFPEGFRWLKRFPVADPLLEERIRIYSTGSFGHYLSDVLAHVDEETDPEDRLSSHLIILSRLPAVTDFRLTASRRKGLRLHLKLSSEDILYRPDDIEAALFHMAAILRFLTRG